MRRTPLKKVQGSYLTRLHRLEKENKSFAALEKIVKSSKDSTVFQKNRKENKIYDETWIENLERGFAALDRITSNPRTFIKENREVVLTALAKKINAESVTHLASHTQFIHSVDEKGNVIPEKILSISTEEDYQIYENRFIMTLINKLVYFIGKRYDFIKSHGETRDSDLLMLHNVTVVDGVTYEYDARIKVSKPSNDNGLVEKNLELLDKIVKLRNRAAFYLTCPFMVEMRGAKPVHNPIAMTNMLMKSPDYHKAYQLWKFIDAYTKLGVTYSIKETNQKFDAKYYNDIAGLTAGSMMTLSSHLIDKEKVDRTYKTKRKKLTPRVLLNLDDETFLDQKFLYSQFGSRPSQGNGIGLGGAQKGPLTPDQLAAVRAQQEAKEREDQLKKKRLEELAARKKQAAADREAALLAAKKKKEEARVAALAAKKAAKEKRKAAAAERRRQAQLKKEEAARRQHEIDLLEKIRRHVRAVARQDKAQDTIQAEAAKANRAANKNKPSGEGKA